MKKYKIQMEGQAEQIIQANTPLEACKKLYPNCNIIDANNKPSKANLRITLVGGQRSSVNYYTILKVEVNELMIVFKGQTYLYFKTVAKTVKEAYKQFSVVCEKNGINMDNMPIQNMTLRNSKYEDIDTSGETLVKKKEVKLPRVMFVPDSLNKNKYILKEKYEGFGIYGLQAPSGYFVSQEWLVYNGERGFVCESYNSYSREELKDCIDRFNEIGSFGLHGYKTSVKGIYGVHPNNKSCTF